MEKVTLAGKEITIRKLTENDLGIAQKHLDYFNAILDENLEISTNKKIASPKEEKTYLKSVLEDKKRGDCIHLVSECEGKIISNVELKLMSGKQSHIAAPGIVIANGFRGIGLGSKLMEKLIYLAKEDLDPPPVMIQSGIFSTNDASLSLHAKFGFKEVARIPGQFRRKGRLIDMVVVQLYL